MPPTRMPRWQTSRVVNTSLTTERVTTDLVCGDRQASGTNVLISLLGRQPANAGSPAMPESPAPVQGVSGVEEPARGFPVTGPQQLPGRQEVLESTSNFR